MTEIRPSEDMRTGTANEGATSDDHMHGASETTDEQRRARVRKIEEVECQRPRGEGVIFTDLPDACVCLIVSYLSPKDVARGACVCLGFRDTLDSEAVWDQFVPKSALKVVGPNDELKAATKKKIFSFLRKPVLLRETLAYWLDQDTGGECYSVAAKGLRVVWGEDTRYWDWSPGSGARWPEVACLRGVCWFHTSGSIKCELSPGDYTLSWRIQYQSQRSIPFGWNVVPTEFSVSTTDGSQKATSHRYLTNNIVRQSELRDLTPVRLVDDRWFEFDAGEITVSDEQRVTSLEFVMVETESGGWKDGISLDGVVLRPSSLTRVTGRYLGLDELEQVSLQNEQEAPDERRPLGLQDFRGRLGARGPLRGVPIRRRRGAIRAVRPNPPPQIDNGEI